MHEPPESPVGLAGRGLRVELVQRIEGGALEPLENAVRVDADAGPARGGPAGLQHEGTHPAVRQRPVWDPEASRGHRVVHHPERLCEVALPRRPDRQGVAVLSRLDSVAPGRATDRKALRTFSGPSA